MEFAVVKWDLCSCSCKFWTWTVEKRRKKWWKVWNFENEWWKSRLCSRTWSVWAEKHKKLRKLLKKEVVRIFMD